MKVQLFGIALFAIASTFAFAYSSHQIGDRVEIIGSYGQFNGFADVGAYQDVYQSELYLNFRAKDGPYVKRLEELSKDKKLVRFAKGQRATYVGIYGIAMTDPKWVISEVKTSDRSVEIKYMVKLSVADGPLKGKEFLVPEGLVK